MDPLSLTASIIAVVQLSGSVISAVYNYRKDLQSAPEYASKIVQDLTGLSNTLEKLLVMAEREHSLGRYRLISVKELADPHGPLWTCRSILESMNEKLQPKHGWRAIRESLVWPLKQGQTRKLLEEIARAKATLSLALNTEQVSIALDTNEAMDAMNSSLAELRIDKQRRRFLENLSPTDTRYVHLAVRRKHQRGTGEWFLLSREYSAWATTRGSVLYVSGIPGCGKTILCSVAIEDLMVESPNPTRETAVAFYYFNFQTRAEQQFSNLLRSLAVQLCYQCRDITRLLNSWPIRRDTCELADENISGVFHELLQNFQKVYIVVDAIDECEQVEEVTEWIQNLAGEEDSNVHVLVSSRQSHAIKTDLDSRRTIFLSLNKQLFEKDIESHIRQRLSTDPRMSKWSSSTHEEISQSLAANSEGLWVDCQLDLLSKCLRAGNISAVLENPPKTLYETYDRIVNSIDEAYMEDALRILQWLAVSARPLRTIELNEALAFDRSDVENPIFNPDLRLPLLEDILTLCSSLVTVSESSLVEHSAKVEFLEVHLAHSSVKDYLESRHIRAGSNLKFALELQLSHSIVGSCCLAYLNQVPIDLDAAGFPDYPLGYYAAQFWAYHVKSSGSANQGLLRKLALQLLTTDYAYETCLRLYNPDRPWRNEGSKRNSKPSRLYYVSLNGLSQLIKPLVINGDNPNEDITGCTHAGALGAAAFKGDLACVEALLAAGADINGAHGNGTHWGGEYGTPIATAASQGHNDTILLLLNAGADPDFKCEDGQGEAVYQAAAAKLPDTLELLLEAGANPDAYQGLSGTTSAVEMTVRRDDIKSANLLFLKVNERLAGKALMEAARSKNRKIFESLLSTPRGRALGLPFAALAGWNDLVQEMINDNVENMKDIALCRAAESGSLETLQTVYRSRGGVPSTKEISRALYAAALNGRSLAVKYLLDRGADTEDTDCEAAMVQAADNGHISTVSILLTGGVTANATKLMWDNDKKSCLWAAVSNGNLEIAKMLLSNSADPDCQWLSTSALQKSIEIRHETIFDLLRSHGASTTAPTISDAKYDTVSLCVHLAASVGCINILRKLLESGHDVDATLVEDGWTALFHSARNGHAEALRVMIAEYHADIHRRVNKGTIVMHTAAYHDHVECIRLLLDAGIHVDVRGRHGRTALHWAAKEGSINAVSILLERGADFTLEDDEKSMTALDIARWKALKVSKYALKHGKDENYDSIIKILEDFQQKRSMSSSTRSDRKN